MVENEKRHSIFRVMEEEHESLKTVYLIVQSKIKKLVPGQLQLNQKEELEFLFNYYQKRLAFHFDIEESIGVLNDIWEREPYFTEKVIALRKEHSDLVEELARVFDFLKVGNLDSKEVIDKLNVFFETFVENLKAHEERETTLVLKAVNTDFGESD